MHVIKSGGLSHREIPLSPLQGPSDTHDATMDIHLRMVSAVLSLGNQGLP